MLLKTRFRFPLRDNEYYQKKTVDVIHTSKLSSKLLRLEGDSSENREPPVETLNLYTKKFISVNYIQNAKLSLKKKSEN